MAIALLLILAGFGLYVLGEALHWWVPLIVVVVIALLVWRQAVVVIARFAGATIAAILVLAGFDLLAGWLHLRPSILAGLLLAVVVFGLAAYFFLLIAGWRWEEWRWWRGWTALAAGLLSVFVILCVPVLVAVYKASGSESVPEREGVAVASRLDVLIVTDGRPHRPPAELPPDPSLSGFNVRYSVGFAGPDRVHWTLAGAGKPGRALRAASRGNRLPDLGASPVLRQGADSVLLLLVDGTAPVTGRPEALPEAAEQPGEIARWRRVAVAFPGTPAFALLQTTRAARLERWQRHFTAPGGAVSAQALQSLTATDAAVRLAIAAPTSQADFALAIEHRPLLLFDEAEPVPRPLSVATLFEEHRVQLCEDLALSRANCSAVSSASELKSGGTHLGLDLPSSEELRTIAFREKKKVNRAPALGKATPGAAPAQAPPPGTGLPGASSSPPGAGSAIYVHPVSSERDGKRLLYLDYWWYLPDNPSDVGGGALCGAGLVIAGLTCNNHQSDWEGLTVVVDRSGAKPFVTAVQYAQHDSVVRYSWHLLRERWQHRKRLAALTAGASGRPLAFIAKGSHATYPTPCPSSCHEVAASALGEGRHRGNLPWIGNATGACGEFGCLQVLPTHDAGSEPALWNAFTGAWGDVHCLGPYYCDSGKPPAAPGQQGRYRHPTQYDGIVGKDWRFHQEAFEE